VRTWAERIGASWTDRPTRDRSADFDLHFLACRFDAGRRNLEDRPVSNPAYLQEPFVASKVEVVLLDDVDGSTAAQTLVFGLDGVAYEIDLSDGHAGELRDSLSAWIGHARRLGRTGQARTGRAPAGRGRSGESSEGLDLVQVRSWARDNGFEISDRGRVSSQVLQAYRDAH
jgi:hypothetical protein